MGTFTVLGIDSSTRRERVVVVEALSETEAAESALEQGFVEVKKVRLDTISPPKSADAPWYADRRAAANVIARAVARGVFFGGLAAIVVVLGLLFVLAVMWMPDLPRR